MDAKFFEDVVDIYSKGSHKLVIWVCPRCKKQFIKKFKQALNSKHCKPCNNLIQRQKIDFRGEKNPFYGKRHTQETIERMSGKNNPMYGKFGQLSPRWNPNKAISSRNIRKTLHLYRWQKSVKRRDDYVCQKCLKKKNYTTIKFCAHHIESFSKVPELRFEILNGITFCESCHILFHKKYGAITNIDHLLDFVKDQPDVFKNISELKPMLLDRRKLLHETISQATNTLISVP